MAAADNYERDNLARQAAERRAARQTITVAAAFAIGTAAVIVAVLAALTAWNLMDALQAARNARCA